MKNYTITVNGNVYDVTVGKPPQDRQSRAAIRLLFWKP